MARNRDRRVRTTQITTSLIVFLIAVTLTLGSLAWLMFSLGGVLFRVFGILALSMLALIAWRWIVQLVQLRKGKWGS